MTSEPLGPVQIGAREIYDLVQQVKGAVERLVERDVETRAEVRDHETRMRALEGARWPLPALAVLISLAALIFPWITGKH